MAFTVTSNYAGRAAGFFISAALNEAKSLDGMTIMENIKYKQNVQRMAGSALVKDSTCDFTDAGTLALTEKVLTPKNLQINLDLCATTLVTSWEADQMKAGAWNNGDAPVPFSDYVISYFSKIIADGVEGSIWDGAAATAGEFEGFQTGTTGMFAVDGTVVSSSASAAYSATNIIANLQTLVADIPATVYGKEDLRIYMNMKTYRFYISAISTLGYVNAYNMNGVYEPVFEGIKIQPSPGMADNVMCAAETTNLFFGTDLLSDTTEIRLMDMSALDGSNNIRVVAKYSAGVQLGVGSDIVNQS